MNERDSKTANASGASQASNDVSSNGQPGEGVIADLGGVATEDRRGAARRAITNTFTVMMLLFAILNWPYEFVVASHTSMGSIASDIDLARLNHNPPKLGGWPFRYWISVSGERGTPPLRALSLRAFFYNVGLTTFAAILLSFYFYRRSRRTNSRRFTITDLLATTLLLALVFTIAHRARLTGNHHRKIAEEVSELHGGVELQSWAPSLISEHVPGFLSSSLERVRGMCQRH